MEKRVRLYLVVVLMLPLAILVKAQRPGDDVRPVPDLPALIATGPLGPPAPSSIAKPSEPGFETILKPFLSENCYRCHGNKKHEKDLNFQSFTSADSLIEHRERWDEVVSKLKAARGGPARRRPATGGRHLGRASARSHRS